MAEEEDFMIAHLWTRATRLLALLALPTALAVSGCDRDDGMFGWDAPGKTPPPAAPPGPVTYDDDAAKDAAERQADADKAAAEQQETLRKEAAEAQADAAEDTAEARKDAAEQKKDAAEEAADAEKDAAERQKDAVQRDAEAQQDAAEDAAEARKDAAEQRKDAAERDAEAREDAAEEAEEARKDRDEAIEERNEAKTYTDAEVLGLLHVLNKGEVDHAKAAQGRLVDPAVKDFCEMMIQHHGEGLRKVDSTAGTTGFEPTRGEKAQELTRAVQGKIEDLADEDANEIDDEFVRHQKAMHEDALKLIDDELMKSATAGAVVALVAETRATVALHLEAIKAIDDAR